MRFGEYFKKLRKLKGFTQEQIAAGIGKSKMLISGVETGRNDAFMDGDLEVIAELLELSTDEKNKLFFEASKARARLPMHLLDYMSKHDEIYGVLEIIVQKEMSTDSIKRIKSYVEDLINAENN